MTTDKNRALYGPAVSQTIITLIASWLMASTVMNLINWNTPSYFSLENAGLEGLLPLLLFWITFTGLLLLIVRKASVRAKGIDIAGRLLFMSWILLALSAMQRFVYLVPAASFLLVNLTSLMLARGIFFSALRKRQLPDMTLCLFGLLMIIINLLVIPWEDAVASLFSGASLDTVIPFVVICIALILALVIIINVKSDSFNKGRMVTVVAITAMLIQVFLSGRILYARFETLSTPTYDFNLFAQMFHNMAETFKPVTTLERNTLLSHFRIHLSPVYYLMLPFFTLIRTPATLNVLQAVIVGSGMVPMVLIARHFRLEAGVQMAFSIIYLFSAALMTSGFYDLHENCFLVPFLLLLILAIEKRNRPGMLIFTLLTLSVKEDAALYVWTLSAFIIFERKMVREGLAMLFTSGAYFIGAVRYLNRFGEGAMTGRFEKLIGVPEWSLLAVPYAVVRNPGFILSKVLAREKLGYIIQMLSPLGFMPLFTRKLSRWVLIVPFLLMNLMVDYQYQYDMRFQYNYGSYVLLLYMALLFVKDQADAAEGSREGKANKASGFSRIAISFLMATAISSGILVSSIYLAAYEHYPRMLEANKDTLTSMKHAMDEIPEGSSVLATCYLTGYLSDREAIYDIDYNLEGSTYFKADYIAIDLRPAYKGDHESIVPMFLSDGYEILTMEEDEILILKR
ncbi:DUF2079 domain-containing protein [Youngiibacter fragilis]|nr:DUF2079 domain-containing protein [Youngiibacter fragilis]